MDTHSRFLLVTGWTECLDTGVSDVAMGRVSTTDVYYDY